MPLRLRLFLEVVGGLPSEIARDFVGADSSSWIHRHRWTSNWVPPAREWHSGRATVEIDTFKGASSSAPAVTGASCLSKLVRDRGTTRLPPSMEICGVRDLLADADVVASDPLTVSKRVVRYELVVLTGSTADLRGASGRWTGRPGWIRRVRRRRGSCGDGRQGSRGDAGYCSRSWPTST